MRDFSYEPGNFTAGPGQTIGVVNVGAQPHTLTSATGAFSVDLAPGAEGSFLAPTERGTYEFVCVYHDWMTGTLTVGGSGPAVPPPAERKSPTPGAALGAALACLALAAVARRLG